MILLQKKIQTQMDGQMDTGMQIGRHDRQANENTELYRHNYSVKVEMPTPRFRLVSLWGKPSILPLRYLNFNSK